jgi:hypothetical protein
MPDLAPSPDDRPRAAAAVAFIYFRSLRHDRDAVRAAHARLALALREAGWPPVEGLALRHESARDQSADEARDDLTWLETYRSSDVDKVHAQLSAIEGLAQDCGLSALALDGRHIEVFEPCA